MRTVMCIGIVACSAGLPAAGAREHEWLPASHDKLPLWRGFNLTDKFHLEWSNGPFRESDFRMMSDWGFNFVRLPMDYRVWISNGDWRSFNDDVLRDIDQAVAWGEQYGIHVCINFHRAPGYTVASPKEATDLWTDRETQEVCALHWATFAKRYRGIPNERVSFNLFNEPSGIDGETYCRVAGIMVDAIRSEDPQRLIIADGYPWCKEPCKELFPLEIAQAARGYAPSWLTHYKASWVNGTDTLPVPSWPRPKASGWLTAGGKKDLASPLTVTGPFVRGGRVRLHLTFVSAKARLVINADDTTVLEREFIPGEGDGDWTQSEFKPQWNLYQATYDLDINAEIPAGTRTVTVSMEDGDWMTLSELGYTPDGADNEATLPLMGQYGTTGAPLSYAPETEFSSEVAEDRAWLRNEVMAPWLAAQEAGIGVMVGEFGAYNKTPHDVTLRWMEDCLRNWRKAGWGWALWNFRGSFGILDSQRKDVDYEDYRGHKLDRKMLDLLRKYQ